MRGCREARGEFIARHDSDDISLPGRLAAQVAFLDTHPTAGMVAGATLYMGPGEEPLFLESGPPTLEAATARVRASTPEHIRVPTHGSVMFRRTSYERAGGYRSQFRYAQDVDLWMRITDHELLGYLPDMQYCFRVRPNSISMTVPGAQRELLSVIVACREARAGGGDEGPLLARAAEICGAAKKPTGGSTFAGNYFLGRLLQDRKNPAATGYLRRAVRDQPTNLKALLALARAQWTTLRGGWNAPEAGVPQNPAARQPLAAVPNTAAELPGISVAIPTYGREQVLVETIAAILALDPPPDELLVVDQTPEHESATTAALAAWSENQAIRWIRLERPSIAAAMNQTLLLATQQVVLFLDDDIIPSRQLIAAHRAAHATHDTWAVVGQILQPGQQSATVAWLPSGERLRSDLEFPFHSDRPQAVYNCMAGNLSVRREQILALGGFDENFVGAAYRFETEFARRIWRSGGRIWFEPAASIRHLQAARGGTRVYGSHFRSPRPEHSVGEYYYLLSGGVSPASIGGCLKRLVRSTATRFHLAHPWWIGPKLIGELRGLAWAVRLAAAGPRLVQRPIPAEAPPSTIAPRSEPAWCGQEPRP